MSGLAQVYRRSWFARIVTTFAAMFTALVGLVLVGVWLATTNLIAESARQELDADLASFAEVYAQRLLPGLREAVERRAASAPISGSRSRCSAASRWRWRMTGRATTPCCVGWRWLWAA